MDMINAGNKIIVRPDRGEISKEFIDKFINGEVKIAKSSEFIRLEHPNCAFFKSMHSIVDKEFLRTTLYTPEGRLHIDFEKNGEKEIQIDKYVKKQTHLDILLFYLRDLEVKPTFNDSVSEFFSVEMPKTPMTEFISFVEKEFFSEIISEYEIISKHILSQLRRIYNSKIEILEEKIKGKIDYAVFENIGDTSANEDLIERWHNYYIRKARLLK